jgi:two-component system sensor histidine kinase TctE
MMQGYPVLVGELVRNLVDNALRYTSAGGTVTARVLRDPFGQVLVLQVEDSGPGIAPAERQRVFEPFYRALGTGVDGTGLGLAIVREIASRHEAEVSIDEAHPRHATGVGSPSSGPGALFTVRFPLQGAIKSG